MAEPGVDTNVVQDLTRVRETIVPVLQVEDTCNFLKDIVRSLKVTNKELHCEFLGLGRDTERALASVVYLNTHQEGDDRNFHTMDWVEILNKTIAQDVSLYKIVNEINGEIWNAEERLVDPNAPDDFFLRAHQGRGGRWTHKAYSRTSQV